MAKTSGNSLLSSLKGRIWLATGGLAFFICVFGLISYLIVSFLTDNTLYGVFIPFVFVAFSVVVFGWWLADVVVGPVEKVGLLAKSLERGVATGSLPQTSGSTETDDLLETLHRISQQVQKLVNSMDEVANGNLTVVFASTPQANNSDRIAQTFQKLLARVSESIHAKLELEKLEKCVRQLSEQIENVKTGSLDAEIKSEAEATRDIAAALRFLLGNLNEIGGLVKTDAAGAQFSIAEARKMLLDLVQQSEARAQEMNQSAAALKKIPQIVQKIAEELSGSSQVASQSIEKARHGTRSARQNLDAVGGLRRQIQEAAARVERLAERSREIGKIAKAVEDLAQRTNLIALNASIQAAETGEKGRGFAIVAEEVERLSERAAGTNKQIAKINQAIQAEISEVGRALEATAGATADLSRLAIESGDALGELERCLAAFLNLQIKVTAYAGEHSEETDRAFQVFVGGVSETEDAAARLKESAGKLARAIEAAERMRTAVAHLKLSAPANGGGIGIEPDKEALPLESFSPAVYPTTLEEVNPSLPSPPPPRSAFRETNE
jgi:methyl-accepting chemotaxis protein